MSTEIQLPRDPATLDLLRDLFSHDEPFGPANVEAYDPSDLRERAALRTFFDKESKVFKKSRKNVSIIFGRRGSGKTNLLQSFLFENENHLSVFVSQHIAFEQMINLLDRRIGSDAESEDVFVEEVADIWKFLFRTILLVELVRRARELKIEESSHLLTVRRYVEHLGLDGENPRPFDELFRELPQALDVLFGTKKFKTLAQLLQAVNREGLNFTRVWNSFEIVVGARKVTGTILLDSVEQIPLRFQKSRKCLAGLLKCLSSRRLVASTNFRIVCALPTEQYYPFYDVSANPNKDFGQNLMLLQWTGTELIHMALRRYIVYLRLHHNDRRECWPLINTNLSDPREVYAAFNEIFGEHLINRRGKRERVIPYLLRHTQLLPRALLDLLNTCARQREFDRTPFYGRQTTDYPIAASVHEREVALCAEVFSAFSQRYPYAATIAAQTLKVLPPFFQQGELHSLYNKHIRKTIESLRATDFGEIPDGWEGVLRMLTEIGAVGRVIRSASSLSSKDLLQHGRGEGETDDLVRYIRAEFEYISPSKLVMNQDSLLCVHPMFAGTMLSPEDRDQARHVVYPLGAAVDDEDFRAR